MNTYFSHDYNSRHDLKILKLLAKYSYRGYGIFWAICEELFLNKGYLSFDDIPLIAYDLHLEPDELLEFINYSISLKLFFKNNDYFFSKRMLLNIELANSKTKNARRAALSRWEKDYHEQYSNDTDISKIDSDEMQTQCKRIPERNADEMQTQCKRIPERNADEMQTHCKRIPGRNAACNALNKINKLNKRKKPIKEINKNHLHHLPVINTGPCEKIDDDDDSFLIKNSNRSIPESIFNVIRDYYNRSPSIAESEKLNAFISTYGLNCVVTALKLSTLRNPNSLILYAEKVCNTIYASRSYPSVKSQNPQLFDSNVDYSGEKEKLKKMVEELLEQNRAKLNRTNLAKINSLISEEKYLSALQTFTELRLPYEEPP